MFVIHKCVAVRHAQTAAKMGPATRLGDERGMEGFHRCRTPRQDGVYISQLYIIHILQA